jgi:hypothetical protein
VNTEPQKEHDWLQKLVGEWTYESDEPTKPGQPPAKCTGTESVRSLGGFWVLAEGQGGMPGGGAATMVLTLGYDPQKKRYVGTWIGSMMSHLWVYEGAVDVTGNTLTLHAEGPNMAVEGKTAKPLAGRRGASGAEALLPCDWQHGQSRVTGEYKEVIEFKSDNHRVFTSHVLGEDGKWQTMMTVNFRRTA